MKDLFDFCDELGPTKIIHVYEPSVALKGIVVVDNVAAGPSIGGIRMAADASLQECMRLARAMTFKNAAVGIPHGGGKSVIVHDPKVTPEKKEKIIRAFACSLHHVEEYILAPDMGTDEICMAWIKDEIDRVVGLPRVLGGIPLDEMGATGWGVRHVAEVALNYCDFSIKGARVVIQGFGAVGIHSARFLTDLGAVLVGAADSTGSIYHPDGLDVDQLIMHKRKGQGVSDYEDGQSGERDAVIGFECDIWIPAARPDVINEHNVDQLKTKLVIEGANIPITEKAEQYLYDHHILYIPDFIANAGGVVCAALEYAGASEQAALDAIAEKLSNNTDQILAMAKKQNCYPREAAYQLARERINQAMSYRRWSLF